MRKKKFDQRQTLLGIILSGIAVAILLLTIALLRAITTNSWPDGFPLGSNQAGPTPDSCSDVTALECVYRSYGKEELYQSGQGPEFKQSKTGPDGFVITLERAYADANLVLISYTYHSPAGRNFSPYKLMLKDATGQELRWEGNASSPVIAGQVAELQAYDASDLQPTGSPVEVKLRLEIPQIFGDYVQSPNPQNNTLPATASKQNDFFNPNPTATQAPIAPTPIATSLSFDFSVPLVAGRESHPQIQAKGSEGGTGTLEEVIVSPTQLRFKVKGTGSATINDLTLDTGPATTEPFPRWNSAGTSDGYQTITFDTSIAWQKKGAAATLKIAPSPNPGMIKSFNNATVVPGGPWVFNFKIP